VAATIGTDARRAALERLIDHAALFPPASMSMDDALAEDERVRATSEAWLVDRFVVPASRVGDLPPALDVPLSVVLDAPLPDDGRIEAVEVPPGVDHEPVLGRVPEVYVEVPFDAEQPTALERLARLGTRVKLRCGGGVTPGVRALGDAVARCRVLGLTFKATAGLHHPVRRGAEHGFLNLLAAAVFGDEEAALADDDPGAFSLDAGQFVWRQRAASAEELRHVRREAFVGFGSCSVAEPVEELRALGVLGA
jgi:hypothetical protein